MKAISVQQPWATFIVEGLKTVEVRSWKTEHRGPLAICASKAPKNVGWLDPTDKVERLMHAGCIIGVVDMLDCRPMAKADATKAGVPYTPGAYAWVIKPISFCRPDPVVGRLGLFDLPDQDLVEIANDATDWIFNYPCPQGKVKIGVLV